MSYSRETKTSDRLGLSLLAFSIVMVLAFGYELIAHGVSVEDRAVVTVFMTAMFAAWATAVFWPNKS